MAKSKTTATKNSGKAALPNKLNKGKIQTGGAYLPSNSVPPPVPRIK